MINPFTDQWLTDRRSIRPRNESRADGLETLDCWINQEARAWDTDAVREAVHPEDVDVVLQTSIPLARRADILRWPDTSDGRATVRSAYHVIHSSRSDLDVGDTVGSLPRHIWPAIWKTYMWPKVQAFLWRLASNSIATKENLAKRGVPTSPLCPLCCTTESREHLIMGCSWVCPVWSDFLGLSVAGGTISIDQWLADLAAPPRDSRWPTVMLACWFIWKARCRFVFDNVRPNPWLVVQQTRAALGELRRTTPCRQISRRTNRCTRWVVPGPGRIKINCDAAWSVESNRGELRLLLETAMVTSLVAVPPNQSPPQSRYWRRWQFWKV